MAGTVSRVLAWPLLLLVQLYRVAISPLLGINCRFQPTCSAYAIEALQEHGVLRGSMLAARRVARCHPWGGSGFDPVPENELPEDTRRPATDNDTERHLARLDAQRAGILNHAYGFFSRGNRDGGMAHIRKWLDTDPHPAAGWAWFFEQMLRWENTEPALLFAQTYINRLLHNGLQIQAVKIMLRARLVNERFRPLSGDTVLAIEAAERSGNDALAEALKKR